MAKKKTKPKTATVAESSDLTEVFRAVVDQSGMSRYQIAQALEITQSSLSRPYTGKTGVPWDLLQAVAEVAGMQVTAKVTAER